MSEVEWLDHPEGTERTRRARPVLLLAASLPWLLVVGLLLLPGRAGPDQDGHVTDGDRPALQDLDDDADGRDADGRTDAAPASGSGGADGRAAHDGAATGRRPSDPATTPTPGRPPATTTVPDAEVGGPPELEATEQRGRWRVAPGIEEAAALAVVVARAWLTGIEPILAVDGVPPAAPDGYAEHLVVEAVEQPDAGAAVVTVVGIVLGGDDLEAQVHRVAVPVTLRPDGPRVAGPPWELPAPSLEIDEPERQGIDDPEERLAASEALLASGLGDHHLIALHDTPGWPVIAEVQVEGQETTSAVWLRRHLGGFVVSGTTMPEPTVPVSEDGEHGEDDGRAGDDSSGGDGGGDGEHAHEETNP